MILFLMNIWKKIKKFFKKIINSNFLQGIITVFSFVAVGLFFVFKFGLNKKTNWLPDLLKNEENNFKKELKKASKKNKELKDEAIKNIEKAKDSNKEIDNKIKSNNKRKIDRKNKMNKYFKIK